MDEKPNLIAILGRYYKGLARQIVLKSEIERLMLSRKFNLMPVGGWAGSNDMQRKASEAEALNNDLQYQTWQTELYQVEKNITLIEGYMKARRLEYDHLVNIFDS